MKKLLAICLSVFLVLGLMPVSFADAIEASATGTTYFEAEDCLTYTVSYDDGSTETVTGTSLSGVKVKTGEYHNGKYMEIYQAKNVGTEEAPKNITSLSIEIPFTVAANGTYTIDLSALAVAKNSGLLTDADLKLNGEILTAISRHNSNWLTTTAKADLTAGVENELEIYITPSSAKYVQLLWDYVSITPAALVLATETKYFEAEDNLTYKRYDADGVYVDEYTATPKSGDYHGGKYQDNYFSANGAATFDKMVVEIPFTVAASGPYSFELYAMANTTNSGTLGTAEMYLNDTKLTDIARKDSTWLTTTAKANLEAGESYTLKLAFANTGIICFLWDYVSVTAVTADPAGTYFEAEDYSTITYAGATQSGTKAATIKSGEYHNGKYVEVWANKVPNTDEIIETASVDVPFIASESGEYTIELYSSANSSYAQSGSQILLNGEKIAGTAVCGEAGQTSDWWKTKVTVDLTAGEGYTLTVSFGYPGSGYLTAYWDYIYIAKTTAPAAVDVAAEGVTTIQAEDYNVYSMNEKNGSKSVMWAVGTDITSDNDGTIISTGDYTWGYGVTFTVPVNAPTTGRYNLVSYMNVDANKSEYSIKVNDGAAERLYDAKDGISGWTLLEKEVVLNEGVNYITYYGAATNSGFSLLEADYITLELTGEIFTEAVTYDAETGNAEVSVIAPAAGKAIIALYGADGALVGYTDVDAEDAEELTETVACTAAPASCKVFVWENFTSVKPIGTHKDLAIS